MIAAIAVGAKSLAMRFANIRASYGTLAMRGIEVAAAVLVLIFSLGLLAGYIISERLTMAA